ncbi:HNH endonuclease signature motif containing protein [Micromonospora echinaurantiaca]|uniref:HNH endonuclease signature motif containing protein n=1 Tax=Micromonospora echinaurantiaca TaxID=47857 RepID=UPI00342A1133
MVRYKYTPEALAAAAAVARSVTEVMRLLGVRVSGGSHAHISRQMKRFGIDTSHFTGQAHNRGGRGRRIPPPALLVKLPEGARRIPGARLKRALAAIGLPENCEACGVGSTWQGTRLTLHVDHINGDFLDNRPHNLRLLCPNCHSQTATYAGLRRPAVVAPDVVYDPEAVTPTGFPIGRRLPRPPESPWKLVEYSMKGP